MTMRQFVFPDLRNRTLSSVFAWQYAEKREGDRQMKTGRGPSPILAGSSLLLPNTDKLGQPQHRGKCICGLGVLCCLFLLTSLRAYSQAGATGTIVGSVVDQTWAMIPNAAVDATNIATNVTSHTQTTDSGVNGIDRLRAARRICIPPIPGQQDRSPRRLWNVLGRA
jgi:hypothetical protein